MRWNKYMFKAFWAPAISIISKNQYKQPPTDGRKISLLLVADSPRFERGSPGSFHSFLLQPKPGRISWLPHESSVKPIPYVNISFFYAK